MTRSEALKISVGDTLRLIKSPSRSIRISDGTWIGAGREFEVVMISNGNHGLKFYAVKPGSIHYSSHNYVTPSEVELVQSAMGTIEKIQSTIDAHKAEMTTIAEKIEKAETKLVFLHETGSEEFNETEFKAYQTLKLIEENPDMSRLDKAKAIAAIVSTG